MQIEIPVGYTARGIPFKHRQDTTKSFLELIRVDVREIEADEFPEALVIRNLDGQEVEKFHFYQGKFWVLDDRQEGDVPLSPQLMKYLRVDGGSTEWVGQIGILRRGTAGGSPVDQFAFKTAQGIEFYEETPESERMRDVSSNDRDEMIAEVRNRVAARAVCVNGRVYSAVPEPTLLFGEGYRNTVEWRIGIDDLFAEKERWGAGYPVSMKEFGRIGESFGVATDKPVREPSFEVDVRLPSAFKKDCKKVGFIKDIKSIIAHGLSPNKTTEYILQWCKLRDAYTEALEKKFNVPDAEMDRLAEIVCDMPGDEADKIGIMMWNNRLIELSPTEGLADALGINIIW